MPLVEAVNNRHQCRAALLEEILQGKRVRLGCLGSLKDDPEAALDQLLGGIDTTPGPPRRSQEDGEPVFGQAREAGHQLVHVLGLSPLVQYRRYFRLRPTADHSSSIGAVAARIETP